MTQIREATFDTLSNLLLLAIKQLVISAGQPVFLTRNESELHSFLYRMQKEFGSDFLELGQAHFNVAGSYPWSQDVSHAFWVLHEAGVVEYAGQNMLVTEHHDTRLVIESELEKALNSNKRLRERFLLFVSRFETLARTPGRG